jgi:hypothetical protein
MKQGDCNKIIMEMLYAKFNLKLLLKECNTNTQGEYKLSEDFVTL